MILVDAITALPGNPDDVELLSRQLARRATQCADIAPALTRAIPVGWSGRAAEAFRGAVVPLSAEVRTTADDASAAAAVLAGYATALREAQALVRQGQAVLEEGRQASLRWSAQPADARMASDPGEEVRARGWGLVERGSQDADTAARSAAWILDRLLELAADSRGHAQGGIAHRFVGGAWESGAALVDHVKTCGVGPALDPRRAVGCAGDTASGVAFGVRHPLVFGKELLDWDTWATDRPRAAGHLLPGLVLAALTGGASRLAELSAAAKAADIPKSLRTGPHRLADINRAPGGPHFDNCPSCAIATDLTLAGSPASAIPGRALMLRELAARYDSMFVMADREWITQQLLDAPSGARGIVFGMRDGREGHVFNAVQEDGHVYFIDGQTGKAAAVQENYVKLFFLRTDQLTPTGAIDKETR
jgi:hypothetical protein